MSNGNGGFGRKFWLAVGMYFTNFGALITHRVSEPTYLTITLALIGGYLTANVVQKVLTQQQQS